MGDVSGIQWEYGVPPPSPTPPSQPSPPPFPAVPDPATYDFSGLDQAIKEIVANDPVIKSYRFYDTVKQYDKNLTYADFKKQFDANPQQVEALYEQLKPKDITGSKINLPDGRVATVTGIQNYTNSDGFWLNTDLGTFATYGKDFIEKGGKYNADKSFITSVSGAMLDEIEAGRVLALDSRGFTNLPTKNNGGLDLSKDFYIFTGGDFSPDFYDPANVQDSYEQLYVGGLQLTKAQNGKLMYAGSTQRDNYTQVGFLHGDRGGVSKPFTGSAASGGFSGSGQSVTYNGSILGDIFGSAGEAVAGAVRGVLSNPIVQLGISAVNPAAGLGLAVGNTVGNFIQGNLNFGDAVKGLAVAAVANQAGGAVGNAVGAPTGSTLVNDVLTNAAAGGAEGLVGAVLSGGNVGDSIVQGVIGGAAGGAANNIVGGIFNDPTRIDGTVEVETPEVVSGGAGVDRPNLTGDLGLSPNQLISNTNISPIGINTGNFTPNPVDPLNPDFNNLGGTFGSEPGLNPVSTPNLTSGGGTGITIPLINADGQQVGFQGSGGSVTNNFNTPLGDPNSFVNNPTITGQPLVSGGTVTPVPDFNSSLTDLANNNVGTGLTGNTGNNVQPVPVQNVAQTGTERFLSNQLKQYLTGLFSQAGNTLVNGGNGSNPLVQNPASGNNTGANMADYSGLIGNLLSQNTQIQRLEDTGNQITGNFNQAAADVNKPFTPYNISSAAGNTNVNGQNITQTLSQPQQQLADVAGQAAGMFGDVNIPGVENIRNTAFQGSQNLLQQAQGFNPQQAAQQEFDALQQLYAPQRERDRMALENRLRMQGRLGASDNPALRQLEESFRQQDLQGSIQSRNLGFERQQQLQNLAQGMFTQGSQAAQLPTQIQQLRAQIGSQGAQASQLPFQTADRQQQTANQLAATQSSQGTALANVIANLRSKGLETQAGLISQAGALRNARDVAAIQGVLGGASGGGGVINNVASGLASGVGGAVNNAIGSGVNALAGLVGSGVSSIGDRLAGLFTNAYVNPANAGLSAEQLNAMTDDQFLDFIMNDAGD